MALSQRIGVSSHSVRFKTHDGLTCFAQHYKADIPSRQKRLPVICLHGLTRNSSDFEVLGPYLAGYGRDAFALDCRGRGKSEYDKNANNYKPATYAKDVLSFMDHQGLDHAHFIGTSLGGLVTTEICRLQSNRIAGTVINDVGPEIDPGGLKRITSYAKSPSNPQTWEEAVDYTERVGRAAFPNFARNDWERFAKRTFDVKAGGGISVKYDPAIVRPAPPFLAKIISVVLWRRFLQLAKTCPLLLIRGQESDILSAETVRKFKKKAPHMMVVEIPERGHAPSLEEEESKFAIQHFLALADPMT